MARVDKLPSQWLKDFDKAKETAAQQEKSVLVFFSATWCQPCRHMIEKVFPDKKVIKELNNWIPVYVDGDESMELAMEYKIIGFPTCVLLNADGNEIARFVGGVDTAAEFLRRLANAKEFGETFAPLKAKLVASPTNTMLLKQMGDLLAKSERMEDAYRSYAAALDIDPSNAMGIPREIVSYIQRRGNYEKELARLNTALAKTPDNAILLNERGQLKYANRDWTAGEDFARALELDNSLTNGIPPEMLERLLSKVMFNKELRILDELIAKSPDSVSLRMQRADLLSSSMDNMYNPGNITKALEDYRMAAELDSNNATRATSHILFLNIFRKMQMRDAQETISDLKAFEQKHPDSSRVPVSMYLRAMALIQSEDAEKGAEILDSLVQKYPDHELGKHIPRMLEYIKAQINLTKSGNTAAQSLPPVNAR
jgi:thioredoxin-like negative regulator of GroEL